MDFGRAPFLTIWETTRACGLACRHCRAEAIPERDPRELTTEEGRRLLDEVASMGTPIVILSGGDPLERPDLEELVRHAKRRGLRAGTIPAATPKLRPERVRALKDAGLDQLALSLDGPDARAHDDFRKTPGAFAKTMEAAAWAREAGLPLQINTCLGAWNFRRLDALVGLVRSLGIVFWEVFFLVPMGRGKELRGMTADEYERAFETLSALAARGEFVVKVTEAQHYRRFVTMKESAGRSPDDAAKAVRGMLARPKGVGGGMGLAPQAVNSGKGFAFVDHVGDIFPSGFLPLRAGNVRTDSLAEVYRSGEVFRRLRDPALLKGRCGACEFAAACGGSRARAYALTGDYLETDPCCAYQGQA